MNTLHKHRTVADRRNYTAGHDAVLSENLILAAAHPGGFVHTVADISPSAVAFDCESLLAVR
jgi:hypothetical protein